MDSKRIIICGNGSSVRQDQWDKSVESLPLWNLLKNEVTITLNYSYKYLEPTIACFYDESFYLSNLDDLKKLPLIIGANRSAIRARIMPNTYLVPVKTKDLNDPWGKGFYGSNLVGVFALSLAINLGFKEIILLGYDFGGLNGHTHYYEDEVDLNQKDCNQQRKYRGIGWKDRKGGDVYRCNNYNKSTANEFDPFLHYEDVKILNCSVNSRINQFPKIGYDQFYRILENDPRPISQSYVRDEIETTILHNIKK